MTDWRYLTQIFSEAHIVDVDLSEWDRRVSLLAIAGHVERVEPSRLPLLLVHFIGVRALNLQFRHFHVQLPDEDHVQWQVDQMSREPTAVGFRVTLVGSLATPRLDIDAAAVETERVTSWELGREFPGWSRPGAPFVRPGIAELLRRGSVRGGGVAQAPAEDASLEQIFSDARVIDVDLWEWDRRVSLLVLAENVEWVDPTRPPVLLVHFRGVRALDVYGPSGRRGRPNAGLRPWCVGRLASEATAEGERLSLFEAGTTPPMLAIEATRVDVERIAAWELDQILPGWSRADGAFVRASVVEILRTRQR
ncbi:MAG TPA: hypothetical protein VM734_14040 [Kofleriaceae bacterium]|nr:hypothetical protein [Kofleriaceae bacterium]